MAATVTGAVFDVTNQGVEMFPLKNSFLETWQSATKKDKVRLLIA